MAELGVGARLGPYELLRVIGRGGFAMVWLARLKKSRGFEKLVAIKTIRPELAPDDSFEKMFVDEARIASGIEHPNVARVVDFGEERGSLFIVMEYVAGDSLSAVCRAASRRRLRMPIDLAVSIVADTCAGLHAAHELQLGGKPLGVVHRDVSPQNVLVSESGIPKLVDFGIARAVDRLSADTAPGHPRGKLRYIAPEQLVAGKSVDRRADVWGAGAVLYELIEGRPIYAGPNDMARLHALISGMPIEPFRREVSPAVASVVLRALSHSPDDRWATARDMREALLDALVQIRSRVSSDDIERFCTKVMPTARADRERALREAIAEAEARSAELASVPASLSPGGLVAASTEAPERSPSSSIVGRASGAVRVGAFALAGAMLVGLALLGASRSTATATTTAAGSERSAAEVDPTPRPMPHPTTSASVVPQAGAPEPATEASAAGSAHPAPGPAPPPPARIGRGAASSPRVRPSATSVRPRPHPKGDDDEIQ